MVRAQEVAVADSWSPEVQPGGTDRPVQAGAGAGAGRLRRGLRGGGRRALSRTVALKVVKPGTRIAARGSQWLLREAEAVARLNHPNIVTLHDFGQGPSGPYLVFELLRGQSLAERLRSGPLPLDQVIDVGHRRLPGAGPRPRRRRHPPRPHRRQRPPGRGRGGEGARLRPGPPLRPRRRQRRRHPGLHGAGAVGGRPGRRPDRPVRARRDPVPGAHRAPSRTRSTRAGARPSSRARRRGCRARPRRRRLRAAGPLAHRAGAGAAPGERPRGARHPPGPRAGPRRRRAPAGCSGVRSGWRRRRGGRGRLALPPARGAARRAGEGGDGGHGERRRRGRPSTPSRACSPPRSSPRRACSWSRRPRLAYLSRQAGLGCSGALDAERGKELARMAGAAVLLVPSAWRRTGAPVVGVRAIEAETGRTLFRARAALPRPRRTLAAAVDLLSDRIRRELNERRGRPAPAPPGGRDGDGQPRGGPRLLRGGGVPGAAGAADGACTSARASSSGHWRSTRPFRWPTTRWRPSPSCSGDIGRAGPRPPQGGAGGARPAACAGGRRWSGRWRRGSTAGGARRSASTTSCWPTRRRTRSCWARVSDLYSELHDWASAARYLEKLVAVRARGRPARSAISSGRWGGPSGSRRSGRCSPGWSRKAWPGEPGRVDGLRLAGGTRGGDAAGPPGGGGAGDDQLLTLLVRAGRRPASTWSARASPAGARGASLHAGARYRVDMALTAQGRVERGAPLGRRRPSRLAGRLRRRAAGLPAGDDRRRHRDGAELVWRYAAALRGHHAQARGAAGGGAAPCWATCPTPSSWRRSWSRSSRARPVRGPAGLARRRRRRGAGRGWRGPRRRTRGRSAGWPRPTSWPR